MRYHRSIFVVCCISVYSLNCTQQYSNFQTHALNSVLLLIRSYQQIALWNDCFLLNTQTYRNKQTTLRLIDSTDAECYGWLDFNIFVILRERYYYIQ